MYHNVCQNLDKKLSTIIFFCDISVIYRVWQVGLIQKLRSYGISGKILDWVKDYIRNNTTRSCKNSNGANEIFKFGSIIF
jgi:hypothetical protein